MSPVGDPMPNPEGGRADCTSLSIAAKGSSSSGCGGDPSVPGPDVDGGSPPKNEGSEILLDEQLLGLSLCVRAN